MAPLDVLMVGTGEYTTGFVHGGSSGSDKKIGVVALTLFDLRRRGKVGNLSMVGTSGGKFPAIRKHLKENVSAVYNNLDTSFASYPSDDKTDPEAYKKAIEALPKGSALCIFTPDPTHYPIALYAIERGHHVLITKPAVKTLKEHQDLISAAATHNVLVYIEHHKRFDPAYADARHRAPSLGPFSYFYAYMSQPKSQLLTFRSWAGRESDISYYLNSHHIDILESMVAPLGWRPVRVTASGSVGVAEDGKWGCVEGTEDVITLLVEWVEAQGKEGNGERRKGGKRATAVFTASWTAPLKAGVHSQQGFHYLGGEGEIRVDQAKRGYEVVEDGVGGPMWYNPFYMKYAPDEEGNFDGQAGYGYVSFEKFVDGAIGLKDGRVTLEGLDKRGLPTLNNTIATTAILEAGRKSLDEHRGIEIQETDNGGWALK